MNNALRYLLLQQIQKKAIFVCQPKHNALCLWLAFSSTILKPLQITSNQSTTTQIFMYCHFTQSGLPELERVGIFYFLIESGRLPSLRDKAIHIALSDQVVILLQKGTLGDTLASSCHLSSWLLILKYDINKQFKLFLSGLNLLLR